VYDMGSPEVIFDRTIFHKTCQNSSLSMIEICSARTWEHSQLK
jgi:hypothetical protein